MSVAEMKKEISEKLERLNEDQLNELNLFINKINNIQPNEWDLEGLVDNIVSERSDVLKKLAE